MGAQPLQDKGEAPSMQLFIVITVAFQSGLKKSSRNEEKTTAGHQPKVQKVEVPPAQLSVFICVPVQSLGKSWSEENAS